MCQPLPLPTPFPCHLCPRPLLQSFGVMSTPKKTPQKRPHSLSVTPTSARSAGSGAASPASPGSPRHRVGVNLRALVGAYTAEERAELLEATLSNDVPPYPPASDWTLRGGVRALTSVYLATLRGNGHTGDQLMERFKAVFEERKTDEVTLERQIVANLRTTFTHLEKDSGPRVGRPLAFRRDSPLPKYQPG